MKNLLRPAAHKPELPQEAVDKKYPRLRLQVFLGYVIGTALLANVCMGFVTGHFGWNGAFIMLLAACSLAVVFMAVTNKKEVENVA